MSGPELTDAQRENELLHRVAHLEEHLLKVIDKAKQGIATSAGTSTDARLALQRILDSCTAINLSSAKERRLDEERKRQKMQQERDALRKQLEETQAESAQLREQRKSLVGEVRRAIPLIPCVEMDCRGAKCRDRRCTACTEDEDIVHDAVREAEEVVKALRLLTEDCPTEKTTCGEIDEIRDIVNDPERDDAPGESTLQPSRALCSNADQAAAGSSVTFDWKGKAITLQPARLQGGALVRYADEHWAELQKHRKLVEKIADLVLSGRNSEELSDFYKLADEVIRHIQEIDA